MTRRFVSIAVLSAVAALSLPLASCHSSEPKSPEARLTDIDPPHHPDPGHYPSRIAMHVYSVYLADTVRHICAGSAPFFEYDSSAVEAEDKSSMNNLAQCMKTGPLEGKNILLTGRTDPRGSEEYNEQLGLERAEKIKSHLVRRGIDGARIKTASLGKTDASPSPKDWQGDRRVQIELAP